MCSSCDNITSNTTMETILPLHITKVWGNYSYKVTVTYANFLWIKLITIKNAKLNPGMVSLPHGYFCFWFLFFSEGGGGGEFNSPLPFEKFISCQAFP